MDRSNLPATERSTQQAGTYTHGYNPLFKQIIAQRTASDKAGFLLPHLRSGMMLLDCGCGPGSITLGLAEAVAPGEVTGIDINEKQIEEACNLAEQQQISNVRFQVANIYELPFEDETFDAVFAHTLLEHVKDPLKAIKEMYRVLKPGGIIGIRDGDWGTHVISPATPLLDQGLRLYSRIMEYNGTSPFYARHQRLLFREAGFRRIARFAIPEDRQAGEETRQLATFTEIQFRNPVIQKIIFEKGWLDPASLEIMISDYLAWGNHPDACLASLSFAALGWKDKAPGSEEEQ